MLQNKIFIRNETYNNEYRCPVVPKDISLLISYGYIVYVESSNNRCYTNDEYENYGAIIITSNWINYNDCLIIGLKELTNLNNLNNHTHIYFSHSYKNQSDSLNILTQFKKSNSKLYDLEYFSKNNNRIISFSYYAGIVGCGLGLLQYLYKLNNKKLNNLTYWDSVFSLFVQVNTLVNLTNLDKLKICLIGSEGKCGSGVKVFLNLLNINYFALKKKDNKSDLQEYDIIFNCINLKEDIGVWFDTNTIFNKNLVIVDISCDYNNPYNPIKIYNNKTTWIEPVYVYNEYVDIIAIDNLPSLLPFDSSNEFSSIMVELLKTYNNDIYSYWENNLKIFNQKIKLV